MADRQIEGWRKQLERAADEAATEAAIAEIDAKLQALADSIENVHHTRIDAVAERAGLRAGRPRHDA